eukprot:4813618-Pleurochrysis_carterae.AAC.1
MFPSLSCIQHPKLGIRRRYVLADPASLALAFHAPQVTPKHAREHELRFRAKQQLDSRMI